MAQNDLVTKFPFGLSSRGMPVIGGGGRETTGNVFFVSSTAAGRSDNINTHGTNSITPFATLDFAVGACTANNGDLIYIMPGHTETLGSAGALDLDVAGITIVGLGNGQSRPKFTLAVATTADIDVDAANITIQNIIIDMTGVNAIISGLDVNAADFCMIDCEIIFATALVSVASALTTDGNADRMIIERCTFRGLDAGAVGTIAVDLYAAGGTTLENILIADCYFVGAFGTGDAIYVNGTHSGLVIRDNIVITLGSGNSAIRVGVSGTGQIIRNLLLGTSLSALFDVSSFTGYSFVENYGYDTDASGGVAVLVPLVGSSLATDVSIYDLIVGAEMMYNRVNYIGVSVDLTSATWNTAAAHEILTIDGAVRVRILPVCTESVTSGGAITFILGTETDDDAMIASTDGTAIDAGMAWLSATPSHYYAKTSVIDAIIAGGQDVGYTIGSNAATDGTIVFHCWWEPLSSGASVSAGLGGAL